MRKNIVISNTTPLIALAGVGKLKLLHQLYGEIIIPEAVRQEAISEPVQSEIRDADWIITKQIQNKRRKNLFQARLHAGEVEVMILAEEINADLLIIDDRAARKTAEFLGYDVTGTIGILLAAKKRGFVPEVKSLMEAIIGDGFYASEKLQETILRNAGEL